MSSLESEIGIFTIADSSVIGSKVDEINLRKGTFGDLEVTGSATFDNPPSFESIKLNEIDEATTGGGISLNGTVKIYTAKAQSTGTTPIVLITIPTATNTVNLYTVETIAWADPEFKSASFKASIRLTNVNDTTVQVGTPYDQWSDVDSAISSVSISLTNNNMSFVVNATGTTNTVYWQCYVRQLSMTINT